MTRERVASTPWIIRGEANLRWVASTPRLRRGSSQRLYPTQAKTQGTAWAFLHISHLTFASYAVLLGAIVALLILSSPKLFHDFVPAEKPIPAAQQQRDAYARSQSDVRHFRVVTVGLLLNIITKGIVGCPTDCAESRIDAAAAPWAVPRHQRGDERSLGINAAANVANNAYLRSIVGYETLGVQYAMVNLDISGEATGMVVAAAGLLGVVFLLSFKALGKLFDDVELILYGIGVMILSMVLMVRRWFRAVLDDDMDADSYAIWLTAMVAMYGIGYPVGHTAVIGWFSKAMKSRPQGFFLGTAPGLKSTLAQDRRRGYDADHPRGGTTRHPTS